MRTPASLALPALVACLVACHEKETTVPPPPALDAGATASAAPTVTTSVLRPDERRPGQRCLGSIVGGLHPGAPVDYLELRLDYYHPPGDQREIVTAGSSGKACATAKDAAACTSGLAKAKAAKGGEYLVYTRGDEVGTVYGKAVAAFLAPIDAPEEAAASLVYALADGTSAAAVVAPCDASLYKPARQGSDGFEMTYTQDMTCGEKTVTTVAVSSKGESKTLKEDHTPPKPGCSSHPVPL